MAISVNAKLDGPIGRLHRLGVEAVQVVVAGVVVVDVVVAVVGRLEFIVTVVTGAIFEEVDSCCKK